MIEAIVVSSLRGRSLMIEEIVFCSLRRRLEMIEGDRFLQFEKAIGMIEAIVVLKFEVVGVYGINPNKIYLVWRSQVNQITLINYELRPFTYYSSGTFNFDKI